MKKRADEIDQFVDTEGGIVIAFRGELVYFDDVMSLLQKVLEENK